MSNLHDEKGIRIPFTKLQGIGNDFVLVDGRLLPEMDWSALSVRTADRHFAIGHDGLLVILASDKAQFQMRMFNPDGSEDMCGNGLRCAVRYLHDQGEISGDATTVETLGSVRPCEIWHRDSRFVVRAVMGKPILDPERIPVLAPEPAIGFPVVVERELIPLTVVSTGTPHAILFRPLPDKDELITLGPALEHHSIFPQRSNIDWVEVRGPENLGIRTWERGAGATLACGTGASAAMVAAHLHGYVGDRAFVTSPGGTLEIEWDGQGDLIMTGPAEPVFTGEFSDYF